MIKIIVLWLCLLPILTFSQGLKIYQLDYQGKDYYLETNRFLRDSVLHINQTVAYDDPKIIDEESWVRLLVNIKDTGWLMSGKKIEFPNDSIKGTCAFAAWTVWEAPKNDAVITGWVQLVAATPLDIILNFDLTVKEISKRNTYYYRGQRSFHKARGSVEFYGR